jgi:hypothetical protein
MSAELFTLFGRIVTNANQAIAELGKVEGAATKTGASMSLGFAKANAAIQRNAGAIRAAGATITAMGAGLAGAIYGMMRLAEATGSAAEQLRNQAAMTGLSRKQLQEYTFIAQQAGFSTEAITTASAFLQRNLMGIEEGTGNAAKVIEALGVEIYQADHKSLRPMSELLPALIERLQGMASEIDRNKFAAQVFGRGWKEIAPLLAMTTAEMAKQQQAARDLGLVWSDDMFRAADRADAAFDLLHAQMRGVAVTIASAVMPVITELVPMITELAAKMKDAADAAAQWAKENPGLAKGTALAAAGVSGLMLVLGPFLIALPNLMTFYAAWQIRAYAAAAAQGTLNAATVGSGVVGWVGKFGGALVSFARVGGPLALLALGLYAAGKAWEYYYLKSRGGERAAAGLPTTDLSDEIKGNQQLLDILEMEAAARDALADAQARGDKETAASLAQQIKHYQALAQQAAQPAGGLVPTTAEDAEKAHKAAMDALSAEEALLQTKIEEALTDAQRLAAERELAALYHRFANDARLTQTERNKLVGEEMKLRRQMTAEQFASAERDLEYRRGVALSFEAERAALEGLRTLYAQRADDEKVRDDDRLAARQKLHQIEQSLAQLATKAGEAELHIAAARARSWADERANLEATIKLRQQEAADPQTGWERQKAIVADVLGLRKQIWEGDEAHLQTLHDINLAEARSFAQQRGLIEAELARARAGAGDASLTEDQRNAARQRAVQLQQSLNGLNDEAVTLQRDYAASMKQTTAETLALYDQRIADQQKIIDNADTEGRSWREVERAQAAINGLTRERSDFLLRQELSLIEQRIATERTGYDEKIRLLQSTAEAEKEVTKQVELRAEIRATGTAAVQAEIDKLRESGSWDLMTAEQQRDVVAELLRTWQQIAGVALPEVQRMLTELTLEAGKLDFSVRGFLSSMAGQLKSDFAGFFQGLMDGTKQFHDLWASVLADIQRWLAQIMAEALWKETIGKWLGVGAGMIGGGSAGGGGGGIEGGWGDPGFATAAAGMVIRRPTVLLAGERGTEIIRPFHSGPELAMAGAGGGGPITLNVTVNAIDAAGVADVFFRNRGALGAAIQTAMRENAPVGRR